MKQLNKSAHKGTQCHMVTILSLESLSLAPSEEKVYHRNEEQPKAYSTVRTKWYQCEQLAKECLDFKVRRTHTGHACSGPLRLSNHMKSTITQCQQQKTKC